MHLAITIVVFYGMFSLAGGMIGYLKAKSTASLIAGSISGGLLILCAYGIGHGSRAALLGSLAIALVLGARFLGTWLKNHRVIPDLLMILFSVATLLAAGVLWMRH